MLTGRTESSVGLGGGVELSHRLLDELLSASLNWNNIKL